MTQPQHLMIPTFNSDDHHETESILHTQPLLLQPFDTEESSTISSNASQHTGITVASEYENDEEHIIQYFPTTALEDDTNGNGSSSRDDNNDNIITPHLGIPLLILFGLHGLTLSLPTLPLMYILNTRVEMPLSLLPTYGALSFLPFSFKPLYAYWSSHFPRRLILAVGWILCAVTSLGWTVVSSTPMVFIMGISNGIAMAWTGFLLGLTILDQATRLPHYVAAHNNDNNSNNTRNVFSKAASVFQSQAATARNVGSFAGSLLTCLVFGMNHHHSTSTMNNTVTNALLVTTAGCHLISFAVVCCCRTAFAGSVEPHSHSVQAQTQQTEVQTQTQAEADDSNGTSIYHRTNNSRHPSYASMDVYLGNEDTDDNNNEAFDMPSIASPPSLTDSSSSTATTTNNNDNGPFPWNRNIVLVGALQVSIVLLALKGPIRDTMEHHPNAGPILGGGILLALTLLATRLYYTSSATSFSGAPWKLSHMVGLVLILRHAIPSTTSILSAFLYQCLKDQPVWLQVFSLVDNGVVTLSSWSYQKIWATRYSHGRKLIHFMMVTTIVAALADYLYVALVRSYQEMVAADTTEESVMMEVLEATKEDYGFSSPKLKSMFPWMVLAVKMITAFFDEWNFLPDVVLATVSVSIPTTTAISNTDQVDEERGGQSQPDSTASTTTPTVPTVVAPAASGVEYGSLISCIDFGDQLGTILATPFVSFLGITRENGWHHLDLMIQICVGLGILSVGILTILLRWFPRDVRSTTPTATNGSASMGTSNIRSERVC